MKTFVLFFSIICLLCSIEHIYKISKSAYQRTPAEEAFNAAFNAAVGVLGIALWWAA